MGSRFPQPIFVNLNQPEQGDETWTGLENVGSRKSGDLGSR